MKFSIVLSLTMLGLINAACVPPVQPPANTVGKSPAGPAAAEPPATSPVSSNGNRGNQQDQGQGQGQGRGNNRGQSPAPPVPAASATPANPPPNRNNNNGGNNNNNNNNGGNNNNNGGNNNNNGGGNTVQANLVPEFGVQRGVPLNNGNCRGLNNIGIPCVCPPDRNAFIAKMQEFVSAGRAFDVRVSFPTDNSIQSQITRLSTSIVTLQNFNGKPGSGCPASSTTFVAQRAALQAKL